MSSRVTSSDSQISVGGARIKGVTSKQVDIKNEYQDFRDLGSFGVDSRLLVPNQTHTISFDYLLIAEGMNPFDYFFGKQVSVYPSTEIDILDNKEQISFANCYLDSFSLTCEARQIPKASVTFLTSSFSITETSQSGYAYSEDNSDNTSVFRPALTYLNLVDGTPPNQCVGEEGCYCLRSFSIEASASLRPITLIGTGEPSVRVPTFPVIGNLSFEILKSEVLTSSTFIDLLELGKFKFTTKSLGEQNTLEITISKCSLNSINQSLDIDGNEFITFNYDFLMSEDNILIETT